ncbi:MULTISPECIES: threonine ammonia-lyase, biosynthetic [Ectothiorhodospira]|nr:MULTISPECIES: threonine ammonia-lyase, biosynthetic [Ectothiorhodospira]MCG5494437.1 threonine ammonia-lyase, biosynthetic [Ectothiorhodospira variabilis]MCG5498962.1 threonine ammonia-lyase, biosynthetic [Ectothiorhodospira variabilis]MCG5503192.1 threonine ammonia-lyase, biosynthetic [Ectothiorhodospira variabilis]MCG5506049.1 threonine ammonia-lyase, biosynthetic [Ectothiorhodospira variabilis]
MSYPYLQKILTARVYDVARETPLDPMPTLTRRLGNQILLKREDLQPVFSFKLRGAYHKIVNLPREVREKGVICASAGNHAQGVALAGKRLGIKAVIVMPQTTPSIKVEAVRALGGETILHGDSYDDAYQLTQELMEKHGYAFIHPFDDPDVIAGQGTVAMELLRQHPDPLDAVFIPVGGGGLAAGMAVYIKALRPDIKVIGVEPEDAPSMHDALEKKRRIILDQVGIFADGVAVRQAGKENYRICREHMDEVILVTTDEICAATKDVFDDTRVMAEPAGALSVAGLKKYIEREGVRDGRYAAVLSGANINFDRLRHVTERAELGEHREALFAATIPERPGSFRAFCEAIGKRGITEFNYRYADRNEAHIFVGVQLSGGEPEGRALLEDLRAKGYPIEDLSGNEMAKVHLRHMVGGHAGHAGDEMIYRFEFPERPGALMRFLSQMGQDWNISLFHYRNHGAAYGRVLVGIQVPPGDKQRFRRFLKELGYTHWEETENPVYRLFLG